MKKVTTNMTFAQVLFILFILMFSSLMFFYLGAKFGADILTLADRENRAAAEPFLPDDKLAAEIEALLVDSNHKLVFHDVVEGKKTLGAIKPQDDKVLKMTPATEVTTESKLKAAQSAPSSQTAKEDEKLTTIAKESQITKVPEKPSNQVVVAKTEEKPLKENLPLKSDLQPKTIFQPVVQNENVRKVIPPETKTPATMPLTEAENLKVIAPPELVVKSNPEPRSLNKVYRLQLGSYAQKNRALQAKSEWEGRGYTVNLIETTLPGKGNWYRLQLGRFENLSEVQNMQRQIMMDYQQTAMILTTGGH
jgi:cell division septation protein DedD